MNLKSLGSNQTQITTEKYHILISYETPVACIDRADGKAYQTEKKWSRTTSKHIKAYMNSTMQSGIEIKRKAALRPQEMFDRLLEEVK